MTAAPDFRLYHGNDLAVLAGVLAAQLAASAPGASLLEPDTILIPQPAMKRWLQNALAEAHGVAANLRFLTPGEFVRDTLAANLDGADDAALADAAHLRWRLWEQLADPALLRDAKFAPLRPLLADADRERAAWALAGELAAAFEKYQAWRRDWLRGWDRGGGAQDWQAELWRRATRGRAHRGARLEAYLSRYGVEAEDIPRNLPPRLFAFACQNVSPDVLRVIASAARSGPLHFFFVSPVESWWGDLRTARERLRDDVETTFEPDDENPLLRANGAAGRDFVRLLFSYDVVHPTIDLPIYAPPDPHLRTGLLHRLQRDLLARRANSVAIDERPVLDAAHHDDASLQVHACATRLREVQVLHDRLRDLLEAAPRDGIAPLQPRDIAVLTPDIDLYAPAIHAVFGARSGDRFHLPYAVGDTNASAALPLASAFLRLLDLPQSRFGANEVMELIGLPAVAQRLGLESADHEKIRGWLLQASARWGLDAAHRVALGAPEESAYSWAWALDRLLLGHASGAAADIAGVAPFPELEGSDLLLLDALLQTLRTLARLRRDLSEPRPALQWHARLSRALDDLFPALPDDPGDRRALDLLRAQLKAFVDEVQCADIERPIAPDVLRAWFGAALADSDARQPFLTGGITFARMVPMRLIPFRVICVLGMNDGEFPRRDIVGGLNRLAETLGTPARRVGDRSLRDDDRSLFLQLFAAATDVFYLSYLGVDPRSGETLPPAVVVSELLDVAADNFANPGQARAGLTIRHPLQPFAPQAFGVGDARRFSYREEWRVEPTADAQKPAVFAPLLAPRPRDETMAFELPFETLRRDLANPSRAFLRHRLGIQLDAAAAQLPDNEPFGRDDSLRLHGLKQRLFDELAAQAEAPAAETLRRRLLAEGWLAPGAAGELEIAQWRGALIAASRTWREWADGPPRALSFALPLDGVRLIGALTSVYESGLLQFRAGKAHGRTRLDLALEWLVWSALGERRPVHRLVLETGAAIRPPLDAALAQTALRNLIELHAMTREQAIPLMPKTAWAYVEALQRSGDDGAAMAVAERCWNDVGGDGSDRWTRLALRGVSPFDDGGHRFRALALRLFETLGEAAHG